MRECKTVDHKKILHYKSVKPRPFTSGALLLTSISRRQIQQFLLRVGNLADDSDHLRSSGI